jgi:hypothetical protein
MNITTLIYRHQPLPEIAVRTNGLCSDVGLLNGALVVRFNTIEYNRIKDILNCGNCEYIIIKDKWYEHSDPDNGIRVGSDSLKITKRIKNLYNQYTKDVKFTNCALDKS